MHTDFLRVYGSNACSYSTYCHVVSKVLNISFTHLGHEECERCAENVLHKKTHPEDQTEACDKCQEHSIHIKRADEARKEYRESEKNKNADELHVSVDLQKIIMLPRIDMYKEAIFTPRLIAFNESFVPAGKFSKSTPPFAALWHEAVSGRKKRRFNEHISCLFHGVCQRF